MEGSGLDAVEQVGSFAGIYNEPHVSGKGASAGGATKGSRLAEAVACVAGPVAVRHRAYELDPGMPSGERVPVAEYLGRKYGGGLAAGLAMTSQVAAVAAEDGLVLDFSRAVKSSTFDAHRLLALAAAEGAGTGSGGGARGGGGSLAGELREAMYAAHFQQGLALDDHAVLVDLATGVGLSPNRIGEVLASDEFAAEVRADEAEARSIGVTGVPSVSYTHLPLPTSDLV